MTDEPIESALEQIRAAGMTVTASGDRLVLTPFEPEVYAYLERRHAEILAVMQVPGEKLQVQMRDGPPDHFTRVPHVVFRRLMAELSPTEFKLLCFLVDQIYGYTEHRKSGQDLLSYEQIKGGITKPDGSLATAGTGMSYRAIAYALMELERRGIVVRGHTRRKDGRNGLMLLKLVLPWQEPERKICSLEVDEGEKEAARLQNMQSERVQNLQSGQTANFAVQQKKIDPSKENRSTKEKGASRARDAAPPPTD